MYSQSRIHIYSVTKSVLSILIGIAADKGYIQSTDQKVLDFFPGYAVKKREKTLQEIKLKHLLTMTAPYKYKFAPYVKYFTSQDYVKFTLDLLGGRGKIGGFRYTPLIGPDILSGILAEAAGQSVFSFAAENLFSPLGITVERAYHFSPRRNSSHLIPPQISAAGLPIRPATIQGDGAFRSPLRIWQSWVSYT